LYRYSKGKRAIANYADAMIDIREVGGCTKLNSELDP
jgi:hypothetical protein